MASTIIGDFDWRFPGNVYSFAWGRDARSLYLKVGRTIRDSVWYYRDLERMVGSSTFSSARADSELRPLGIRVATLSDLSNPEVMEMVRGKHYSDAPAIVFRTLKDDYEPNQFLINKIVPLVEKRAGKLELPCLVTGFDVISSNCGGYGLEIVARSDFNVLSDKRFEGKYDGRRFSFVDERGLPKFDERGDRVWVTGNGGISRIYLSAKCNVVSYTRVNLASSNELGSIILVRDKAA